MSNLRSGIPPALACFLAASAKTSCTITAVGMPSFSSLIASHTEPLVQDPQAPTPITTSSVQVLSSAISLSAAAGAKVFSLRKEVTLRGW
jgi:hypothetical protein